MKILEMEPLTVQLTVCNRSCYPDLTVIIRTRRSLGLGGTHVVINNVQQSVEEEVELIRIPIATLFSDYEW
jgi:hypothetical protein